MDFKRIIIVVIITVTFSPALGKLLRNYDSTNSNTEISLHNGALGNNSSRLKKQIFYDSKLLNNRERGSPYDYNRNREPFAFTAKENLKNLNSVPLITEDHDFGLVPEELFHDQRLYSKGVEFEGFNKDGTDRNYETQNKTIYKFFSNENQIRDVQDERKKIAINESGMLHKHNIKYTENNLNGGLVSNLNTELSQNMNKSPDLLMRDETSKLDHHEIQKTHYKNDIFGDKSWSKFNTDNSVNTPKRVHNSDFQLNPFIINVNSDCPTEPREQKIHRFIIEPKSQITSFTYRGLPYEVSKHTLFKGRRDLVRCFCL